MAMQTGMGSLSTGGGDAKSRILAMFGNTPGFFFDPSDRATLYQTSGAATPDVAADADPVGKILDQSPNGFHRLQATAASRPLYKTSGGLSWLFYQGTDDYMDNATAKLPLTEFTYFDAIEETTNVSFAGVFSILPSSGNDHNSLDGLAIDTNNGSPNNYSATGSTPSQFTVGQAAAKPTPKAIRELVKQAAVGDLYVNGALAATDNSFTAFSSLSAGGFRTGARHLSGTLAGPYFIGREYFRFFIGRVLNADERALVRNYAAMKAGVTL